MKLSSLPLLLLLLFSPLFSEAQVAVLDNDGDPLQRGRLYYAQSISRGAAGGGLTLTAANESCPSHVSKARPLDFRGKVLSFLPENSTANTLITGATLYVGFSGKPSCWRSSGLWQVSRVEGFVRIGGSVSSAVGPHFSRFSIVRGDGGYSFEACPCSVGVNRGSCRMGCLGALGVTSSRLLSLSGGKPHLVNFVKAK